MPQLHAAPPATQQKALVLSISLYTLLAISPVFAAGGRMPPTAPAVTMMMVQPAEVKQSISALGNLTANQSVNITAEVDGRITQVNLKDGTTVKQGDVLLKLDDREQVGITKQVQIELAEEKRQLTSMAKLIKRKAISQDEYDAQKALVAALEAKLTIEKTKLEHYTITAPFSGTLGFHDYSVGALINAGSVLTTLDDLSQMKLTFDLPENSFSLIKKGTKIITTTDAWQNKTFSGVIESINPRINPANLTFQVRARIANPEQMLHPGMLMRVEMPRASFTALMVPERSVVFDGNKRYVYVIDAKGVTTRRAVETGVTANNQIQILSGITAGMRIVDEGVIKVNDGTKVRILNDDQSLLSTDDDASDSKGAI